MSPDDANRPADAERSADAERPAEAVRAARTTLEALLAEHAGALGRDREAYGNHVRRVFALVVAQAPALADDALELVAVAAVFHDLGIWLDGTFDYLEPSRSHAAAHLYAHGHADREPLLSRMIMEHHRLRPVRDAPLVEAFRRADLCDLTFGRVRRGIPAGTWPALAAQHPTAGFHLRLVQFTARRAVRHPLSPLPMLRW